MPEIGTKILICRVPADAFRIPAGSFCFCRLDVWGLWHSVAGDKKPWILVTQSSGTQRLGPPPQAGNQAFLCPAISYHFNFHSRQLFARKSHGVVIPKSKYCHPPPSSQSHVSPHKLRQKTFSQIKIWGVLKKMGFHFCKFCPSLSFLCKSPDIYVGERELPEGFTSSAAPNHGFDLSDLNFSHLFRSKTESF